MNGFLWVGVACTLLLLVAVLVDGIDFLDALDVGGDWLSLPTVLAFVAAFGYGTGAFVDPLGIAAVVPGIAAGAAFGWGAFRLSRAVMHMRTDATETQAGLLGSIGHIVTPTAEGRYGEVLLDRPTGPVKVACKAASSLPAGTEVTVINVSSSTLVEVAPLGLDTPDASPLDV